MIRQTVKQVYAYQTEKGTICSTFDAARKENLREEMPEFFNDDIANKTYSFLRNIDECDELRDLLLQYLLPETEDVFLVNGGMESRSAVFRDKQAAEAKAVKEDTNVIQLKLHNHPLRETEFERE